nr:FAD-linked oxidase C-terminal domain-containing protein [Stappia sp. WLB 29]
MGSGIPVARIECLAEEHGSAGVCAMAAVKRAFDPRNILNPGKVVEAEETPPFI